MTLQLVVVANFLASAGWITGRGSMPVLDDADADIQQKEAGRNINLHKKGIAFVMWMKIMSRPGGGGWSKGDRNENA